MAFSKTFIVCLALAALALALPQGASAAGSRKLQQLPTAPPSKPFNDSDYFQLALNLEYLEAEFYCYSAYGYGVEHFQPARGQNLTGGGPPSYGGKVANLSAKILSVAKQLCLQEIGHIRIIREYLSNHVISRPLINIGDSWVTLFKAAYNYEVNVNFDPYSGDVAWLLASYVLPYVGLTGYVGTNPNLYFMESKKLLAGVLGVEGSQDCLLRTLLYTMEDQTLYNFSVVDVTVHISALRNKLDRSGMVDDEGLVVPAELGAENMIMDNIISANNDSLSYARNPWEVLAVVYGSGNASIVGGFWPKGANGHIPMYYLTHNETS